MTKFFAILSLLTCSLAAETAAEAQQILPPTRNYSVLSYDLLLDWRPVFTQKNSKFSGENTITIRMAQADSSIVLDATEMRIDSVLVGGVAIKPVPQPIADTVRIKFGHLLAAESQAIVTVYYTRTNGTADGLLYYPKGTYAGGKGPAGDSIFTTEDVAYTMSEPLDAHKWMPCNDEPYNKANAAISIRVPAAYTAQANGTLQSIDTNADGSHTFHYMSDEPIATYLMVANASRWATWKDYYHRISNQLDSVPCVYYVWPSDSAAADSSGMVYNGRYAFRNTPKMLAAFSRLFGEYPFKQYGQIAVQPFAYGGMEHQTLTTLGRFALRGQNEDVIAHELFHQWFGDKTTCETWSDIWLNEGFATLGEALWEEAQYGENAYHSTLQQQAQGFFNPVTWRGDVNDIPVYNPPISNVFNDPTTYLKPGLMLHTLRRLLADDTLFFNTLRDYSAAFAYKTANTFQFEDFVIPRIGARTPMDLKTFFDEWIFQPDWPIYDIRWKQNADHSLTIDVAQSQTVTDHYTMPLRLMAIQGTDTSKLVLLNTQRTQGFHIPLDHTISKLVFDQDAIYVSQPTVTQDQTLSVLANDPADNSLKAVASAGALRLTFAPANDGTRAQLLDILGRVLVTKAVTTGASMLMLETRDLPNGTYFIRLTDGMDQQVARVQIQQ